MDTFSQLGSDIDGEVAGDYRGQSVSLSADGSIVAIGADKNDGNGDASGHVRLHEWNGQKRKLKLKEGGERSVPIHSQLLKRIKSMQPEAVERNVNEPIWPNDYKPSIENWGSTWAETCT